MALTKEQAHFKATAPKWMHQLLKDFPSLSVLDAAAVFGNLGHESKGLTDDQEDKPVVKGSRGGLNWGQWTGPRRLAFEAYCNRNKLDANSDEAAYKWLFNELKGSEKGAIPALKRAATLEDKVKAFEKSFLRAGVKAYDSRIYWAKLALAAYAAAYAGDHAGGGSSTESPAIAETGAAVQKSGGIALLTGFPGWLPGLIIAIIAALVGAASLVWGQAAPETSTNLLGNAPSRLFGGDSGSSVVWQAVLMPIVLSFIQPIVAAAAAWVVGQITYWWYRLLKVQFDAESSARLHKALENAIFAGIEAFGPRATRGQLQAYASDYVQTFNKADVKRFKLGDGELQQLAVPHIGRVNAVMRSRSTR